jgi:hypothetical protein
VRSGSIHAQREPRASAGRERIAANVVPVIAHMDSMAMIQATRILAHIAPAAAETRHAVRFSEPNVELTALYAQKSTSAR